MYEYREFVAAGIGRDVSPWQNLVAGLFLGGKEFLREVETKVRARKCSEEHPRAQREYRAATLESVRKVVEDMGMVRYWPPPSRSDARALFALLAGRHTQMPRTEITRALGISANGVLYIVGTNEQRVKSDSEFAALVLEAETRLFE